MQSICGHEYVEWTLGIKRKKTTTKNQQQPILLLLLYVCDNNYVLLRIFLSVNLLHMYTVFVLMSGTHIFL